MEEQQGGGPGKEYWFAQDGLGSVAAVMGVETDGAMLYQHADTLGSVRQLTDEAGSVRQARGYSPFGAPTYAAGQSAGSSNEPKQTSAAAHS